MKQQKLLMGMGLVLVFGGLVGLMVWSAMDRQGGAPKSVRGVVTVPENTSVAEKAVPKATLELCEKIQDQKAKDQCFSSLAEVSGDKAVCEKMTDPLERGSCLTKIAVRNQDVALCNEAKIPTERDRCVKSVAEGTLNVAICQQIADPTAKDSCVFTVAARRRDPLQCTQIQNEDQKAACEQLLGKKESK
ncbi:MAG: hypothetical protein AAB733_01810 [Patescibacteria group bacterium]